MPIEFLGSKARLLSFLTEKIGGYAVAGEHFVDLFCGTASVGSAFRGRGLQVTANDHLWLCATIAEANLLNHGTPDFSSLLPTGEVRPRRGEATYESVLRTLNEVEPREGFVFQNYSPASLENCGVARMYFTKANAARIDAIRGRIDEWDQLLSRGEKALLITDLVRAASRHSNTAGTYGCYLKRWKPRAVARLELDPSKTPSLRGSDHAVHRQRAEDLLPTLEADVVYVDPPYTKRQYAAYYHLLETIVRYDAPEISGKTGLRQWSAASSDFCFRRKAPGALERLVRRTRARHLFLSYNSDGQIADEAIRDILTSRGKLQVWELPYQRYRSSSGVHRGPVVTERLYHLALAG
jgi:adenine-specific DNA-methyltransferase